MKGAKSGAESIFKIENTRLFYQVKIKYGFSYRKYNSEG